MLAGQLTPPDISTGPRGKPFSPLMPRPTILTVAKGPLGAPWE
jgi:hypothetical protein